MKVVALVLVSLLLCTAGCPKKDGSTTPTPPTKAKLTKKPEQVKMVRVRGAQLYIAENFRLLVLDGDEVDEAALEAKARECGEGRGCQAMSKGERAALYTNIENADWLNARFKEEQAAQASSEGFQLFLVGPQVDPAVLSREIALAGKWCGPGHPACPPGPIPPRFPELLDVTTFGRAQQR